jgi:hypothetical protein
MASILPYWIKLGTEDAVKSESLGLSLVSCTWSSLAPDEATLAVYPRTGISFAHDTPCRIYAQNPSGTLRQIFVGRINSPEEVSTINGQSVLKVAGGLAGWKDFTMTRTSGSNISPVIALYRAPSQFRQDIKMAVMEAAELAQSRVSGLSGWAFSLSSGNVNFGASPLVSEPEWEEVSDCADWLVKVLRPQTDGWSRFDHSLATPAFHAGRFRDVAAVTMTEEAPPVLSRRERRDRSQEFGGMVVVWAVKEAVPITGRAAASAMFEYPDGRTLDARRTLPLVFSQFPDAWNDGVGNAVAASVIKPWVEGTLNVSVAGDHTPLSWVRPGQVVTFNTQRLHVQTVTLDPRNGVLSASAGPPRQLGVNDVLKLAQWISRTRGALKP